MKNILFIFCLAVLSSCGSSSCESGLSVEEYIAENNLTTKELSEGVHIIIDKPGNSVKPSLSDVITVAYEGRLTNGNVFDGSDNSEFPLGNLIRGWQIGLPEIGEGGECTLILPYDVGYGCAGTGPIPGGATLVFDMTLKKVN
ncbi:MAG: FKBP-type peptidyl-prolyl cis-trans isomerase [Saprospiraceae bacterium]